MMELRRTDFYARFSEGRLEVHLRPHWLPTLGVGLLAAILLVSGTIALVMGAKGAWMTLPPGAALAIALARTNYQTRQSNFVLSLAEGATGQSFYMFKKELKRVAADALVAEAGTLGSVEVEFANPVAPGNKTVEGLKASVTIFVNCGPEAQQWMFRVNTIEKRAKELEAFLRPALQSLAASASDAS